MAAFLALFGDWVLTASWPIAAQSGIRLYSALLFNEIGLAIGFLALLPWLARGGKWRRIFDRKIAYPLFLVGFWGGVPSLCYIWALKYTTPADAGIVAGVEVLYSAGLCAWLLKERITLGQGAASLAVIAGTALVLGHGVGSGHWKGDLIILLSPWMYQLSHIQAKKLPKGTSPLIITAGRAFYQAAVFLPLTVLWSILRPTAFAWSKEGLAVLLIQGLGLSCLNYLFWYEAILNIDLSKATAFLLSYPALTLLMSCALGRETIAFAQVAGLALSLAGGIALSRLILKESKDVVFARDLEESL